MTFDTTVFSFFFGAAHVSGVLDAVFIFFARYLPYLFIIGAGIIVLLEPDWKRKFRAFSLISLSLIVARGIIQETIQFFYVRPRPPIVLGIDPLIPLPQAPSFPSSHAIILFAIATALFFIHKKWGTVFLGCASLIVLARVVVGVHWPLDIVSGAVIAAVSAYIVEKLISSRKGLL